MLGLFKPRIPTTLQSPVHYLHFLLQTAVVVALELELPGRGEVLDGRLLVELAGQQVEQLGVGEAKAGEPVLGMRSVSVGIRKTKKKRRWKR